jgi:hypothetical protein
VSGGGGIGVSGGTMDGTGVYGCNYPMGSVTPHYGVYGIMHGGGYGFGVYYSGGLAGTGGKSCIVETSRGARLLYCQESPECWFEDFGEGHLVYGSSHVELDPLFLETVTVDATNPMKVFVQLGGPCEGVYVQKGLTGFEVLELHEGGSNVTFDYRMVAKRKGFEQKRLDYCKAGETDPYLHAELREKGPQ